uniref:Uncharacterized protein n=1 Tax=Brassica oleracea TaxID=3712 RepID=A0A3P6BUS8_BRAOL|nr:unnamed protein product [Brassica oleracea]
MVLVVFNHVDEAGLDLKLLLATGGPLMPNLFPFMLG